MIPVSARGSDLYYVLRQVPFKKRAAYQALHLLCQEFNQISEHYREPAIAEKKLKWWQEEMQRFFRDKSSHPLLVPLKTMRSHFTVTPFLALIEANLLSLKTHIFETRTELLKHYQHLGGIQFELKARLLNAESQPQIHHTLGTLAEIFRHLIDFRKFINQQHLYFALEDFRQYQIDPAPILQLQSHETIAPLFEAYWTLTQKDWPTRQNQLRPLFLEVKLKQKQVAAIRQQGWQWFRYQVELTPLQKLFFTTLWR